MTFGGTYSTSPRGVAPRRNAASQQYAYGRTFDVNGCARIICQAQAYQPLLDAEDTPTVTDPSHLYVQVSENGTTWESNEIVGDDNGLGTIEPRSGSIARSNYQQSQIITTFRGRAGLPIPWKYARAIWDDDFNEGAGLPLCDVWNTCFDWPTTLVQTTSTIALGPADADFHSGHIPSDGALAVAFFITTGGPAINITQGQIAIQTSGNGVYHSNDALLFDPTNQLSTPYSFAGTSCDLGLVEVVGQSKNRATDQAPYCIMVTGRGGDPIPCFSMRAVYTANTLPGGQWYARVFWPA